MARTVVVTGAASGIGAAVAAKLGQDGWQVIGLDRTFADQLSGQQGGTNMMTVGCDVADAASIEAAFGKIDGQCGPLDAVVCSAGVLATGALMDMPVEDFDRLFAINTRGAFLCARAAVTSMRGRPEGAPAGRVVFLGSISGIRPKVSGGAYGAQKSALHVITGVMAAELGPEGILVNAVAPGTVDTPMIEAVTMAGSNARYRPSGNSPLGRVAQPEDVANVIQFLLGEQSTYVTGSIVPVDGGTRAAFVPPQA